VEIRSSGEVMVSSFSRTDLLVGLTNCLECPFSRPKPYYGSLF